MPVLRISFIKIFLFINWNCIKTIPYLLADDTNERIKIMVVAQRKSVV